MVSARAVQSPRAFRRADFTLDVNPTGSSRSSPSGSTRTFQPFAHPEHLCRETEGSLAPSGPLALPFCWMSRLAGPCGLPRTRRQDASTLLLQPTFASRAPGVDITSRDLPPSAVGNPPAFDGPSRAAACLTARAPASVRSTSRRTGRSRQAPVLFRLSGGSADRDPLASPFQRPELEHGEPCSTSGHLISKRRRHVNDGGVFWIEMPSIVGDRARRPFERPLHCVAPAGRPARLPRVFIEVRDID